MSDPSSSESGSEESPHSHPDGIGSFSAGALVALLDHLEARAELLRWEAREARSRFVRRLVALAAGLVLLVVAYAVGVAALVGWLVRIGSYSWPAVAAFVALGHLLLGAIFLVLARRRGGEAALFPDSIAELRRDRDALRRRAEATRPRDPR